MPIYEYECAAHGTFEALRSMAESGAPTPCPRCGDSAKRILSAPRLSAMSAATYQAHERNEKSRHEPRLLDKSRGDTCAGQGHSRNAHAGHSHAGHSHAGHTHAVSAAHRLAERTRPRRYTGARPWVIEHG